MVAMVKGMSPRNHTPQAPVMATQPVGYNNAEHQGEDVAGATTFGKGKGRGVKAEIKKLEKRGQWEKRGMLVTSVCGATWPRQRKSGSRTPPLIIESLEIC